MTSINQAHCQAALVGATATGQGKTVITAAMARRMVNQGSKVQVFKVGPDYLDPTILEAASGNSVLNLDLWIMGEEHCRAMLFEAAKSNDVILVEGVMGLHDNQPSNAELAMLFGLPVMLVLNAAKFAQTAAAVVLGMECYLPGLRLPWVVGNFIGSNNHDRLLRESVGDRYAGSVRRDPRLVLPERHLGLVQASELSDLDRWLDQAAAALDEFGVGAGTEIVGFMESGASRQNGEPLQGKSIAVARDAAFSFIYPMNIACLENLGAQLKYFSPIGNEALPDCDAVWLPGGYPELYLRALDRAANTRTSIAQHVAKGKPLLAECGGMMYLSRQITGVNGERCRGCGILDAEVTMHKRFQAIGHLSAEYSWGEIRGHTFHHSTQETREDPWLISHAIDGTPHEGIFRSGSAILSYMHHYFPSSPAVTACLFGSEL